MTSNSRRQSPKSQVREGEEREREGTQYHPAAHRYSVRAGRRDLAFCNSRRATRRRKGLIHPRYEERVARAREREREIEVRDCYTGTRRLPWEDSKGVSRVSRQFMTVPRRCLHQFPSPPNPQATAARVRYIHVCRDTHTHSASKLPNGCRSLGWSGEPENRYY